MRAGTAASRWVLLATVLGSSMALLDSTVVNVALPSIGAHLGASLGDLQWTVTAYTLTLASLILLGGALGDRLGRRRVFTIGVAWFAVASALCGAAPTAGVLIGARALQGVGGALLTPGSLAIIQASFDQPDRPRAVGLWSGLGGVAGAAGPLLGGWLVQTAGWRWVFLINLPIAAVVMAVAIRHVPESSDPSAHGRFDIAGACLAVVTLAGITYALIEAPASGGAGGVAGSAAAALAGVAGGVAFIMVERRRSRPASPRPPMLPLGVFSSRQFSAVNAVTFVVYAGFGGFFFLLVLQLQIVSGFSPLAAGTSLLPSTAVMLALSSRAGSLAQRTGPRWLMTGGTALCAAGLLLATRVGPHASYLTRVLPPVLVFGLGLSLTVAPLTATVLASAQVRRAGVASGVNNAVARAAGLVAVAGLPAVAGLGPASYHHPAVFASGFRTSMIICAALLAAGSALSALLIDASVLRPQQDPPQPLPQCRVNCPVGAPPAEPGQPGHASARRTPAG